MKNTSVIAVIISILGFSSCTFFEELINPSDVRQAVEAGMDMQGPTLKIQTPVSNKSPVGAIYSLKGIVSDNESNNISNVFIRVDNGEFSPVIFEKSNDIYFWYSNITLDIVGEHTNYVYAIDKRGNRSATNIRTVVYNKLIVFAGTDQIAGISDSINLSGTATDPNGDTLFYSWIGDASNPTNVTISDADTLNASFIMPESRGDYTFIFTSWNSMLSNSDSVTITLTNALLIVDVGSNLNATNNQVVLLAGSASDPNGDILTYSWKQESGNPISVTLNNADTDTATFTMPENVGKYTFYLEVSDGLAVITNSVFVYHGSEGLSYTLINGDTEYSVSNDSVTAGYIYIPAIYNGKSVTLIEDYAFSNCQILSNITMPDSITNIGNSAFGYCSNLTSVKIPDLVTIIGNFAFQNCTSVTNVDIGDSVVIIEASAFSQCKSLTNIVIGNSVISIGNSAFIYCYFLTNVIIGNSVESIGGQAFYNCYYMTNLIIGNSVKSIGWQAFDGCNNLKSVTIPDSITNIGDKVFNSCSSMTNVIMESETPPTLGTDVFLGAHTSLKIHVPSIAASNAYVTSGNWATWASKIVVNP